jgi:hypothetical protein
LFLSVFFFFFCISFFLALFFSITTYSPVPRMTGFTIGHGSLHLLDREYDQTEFRNLNRGGGHPPGYGVSIYKWPMSETIMGWGIRKTHQVPFTRQTPCSSEWSIFRCQRHLSVRIVTCSILRRDLGTPGLGKKTTMLLAVTTPNGCQQRCYY